MQFGLKTPTIPTKEIISIFRNWALRMASDVPQMAKIVENKFDRKIANYNHRNVEKSQHGFKDQSLRIEIVWKFCLWGLFDNLIINSPISYDPLGIFKMLSRMGHYNGLCNAICMVPLWCQNWVIKFVWICSSAHSKLCKKGSACYSGNQIQFFYTDIWVWEVKSYSGFPVLTLNS